MKIHLAKKSGNSIFPTLTACGTRPRKNSHARIYNTAEFAFHKDDSEMVCEKCLQQAKESGRIK